MVAICCAKGTDIAKIGQLERSKKHSSPRLWVSWSSFGTPVKGHWKNA
jgi:hypothetical protein